MGLTEKVQGRNRQLILDLVKFQLAERPQVVIVMLLEMVLIALTFPRFLTHFFDQQWVQQEETAVLV